jgi:hypothetical protein
VTLSEAVTALCRDVNGIDWNAEAVQADIHAMLAANKRASQAERAAAFAILLARLRAARVEDADGVAHVAISAATLVEFGAPARPLAEVMLEKLRDVLVAARWFADTCLADLQTAEDDAEETDRFVEVNECAIPRNVFRRHVADDRPGAAALDRLRQWGAAGNRGAHARARAAHPRVFRPRAATYRARNAEIEVVIKTEGVPCAALGRGGHDSAVLLKSYAKRAAKKVSALSKSALENDGTGWRLASVGPTRLELPECSLSGYG